MKTPAQLAHLVSCIIADSVGCLGSWSQHQGPLTTNELYKIRTRIEILLRTAVTEATDAEIEARRRIKAGVR